MRSDPPTLPEERFRELCTARCKKQELGKPCKFCCLKLLDKMLHKEHHSYSYAVQHICNYGDKHKLFPCVPHGGYQQLATAVKRALQGATEWPSDWVNLVVTQFYKQMREHTPTEQDMFDEMLLQLWQHDYAAFKKQASIWYTQFGANNTGEKKNGQSQKSCS